MTPHPAPFRPTRIVSKLALLCLVAALPAAADVVRLKNGGSLEGVVTEADGQVKVRSAGGTIGFPSELVQSIERGSGVEQRAQERLQALSPNDVEGRVDLALELQQAGANTMAQRIFEAVLERDPDHPTARRALGYVRCDDEWTSDEECHRRRGEVLYQGRWVGSDERSVLETLAHERRQRDLERLRADIQIESARLQAERDAAAMSYGDGYYDPYGYDGYYGGVPYYPFYPGYGVPVFSPMPGGGRGRFDHVGHHGHHGRSRFDGGRRSEGGLHHRGGQPARPLRPTHNTASRSPGVTGRQ